LMMSSLTDEGFWHFTDPLADKITSSSMTADDQAAFSESKWAIGASGWNWANAYKRIRACNILLSKANGVPFTTEAEKNQFKGEGYFLRAYNYYLLMLQYGGVPLIDKPYSLGDDYLIVRNSFEETINFI